MKALLIVLLLLGIGGGVTAICVSHSNNRIDAKDPEYYRAHTSEERTSNPVPEPMSIAMIGLGVIGMIIKKRIM